ncbi:MAG: hypothetical protein JOS17DRAFT_569874 [Linnemannia elongata]|nr:MAG: hypothetical protein JOS17DRAFT_569874 [Linnemannia elongata]
MLLLVTLTWSYFTYSLHAVDNEEGINLRGDSKKRKERIQGLGRILCTQLLTIRVHSSLPSFPSSVDVVYLELTFWRGFLRSMIVCFHLSLLLLFLLSLQCKSSWVLGLLGWSDFG